MSLNINSFQRVFSAETGLASAAGDYKSSTIATVAKGFLGVITLGIGYGVMKLYEHFNSRAKVEQFTSMSDDILRKLNDRGIAKEVEIVTSDHKNITLKEDGNNVIVAFDGKMAILENTTLDKIKENLTKDICDNPELYGNKPINHGIGKEKGVSPSRLDAKKEEYEKYMQNNKPIMFHNDGESSAEVYNPKTNKPYSIYASIDEGKLQVRIECFEAVDDSANDFVAKSTFNENIALDKSDASYFKKYFEALAKSNLLGQNSTVKSYPQRRETDPIVFEFSNVSNEYLVSLSQTLQAITQPMPNGNID